MVAKYVITIGYQSVNQRTGQITQNIKTKTRYFDSRGECERFLLHWDTGLRTVVWSTVGIFEVDLFSYLNEILNKTM